MVLSRLVLYLMSLLVISTCGQSTWWKREEHVFKLKECSLVPRPSPDLSMLHAERFLFACNNIKRAGRLGLGTRLE